MQSPRQDDWKRNFIELNSPPVRFAINPKVLMEATVGLL
jgi:hypothetical protein